MDQQIIDNAKAIVRNKYGSALAEKASDAFCLSLTPQLFANASMLEAAPPTSQQASMIIEFTPEPEGKKGKKANKALVSRDTDAWKNFKKAVEEVKISSEEVKLQLEQMLRQARIKPSREKFLKSVGTVTAHIESSLGRLYALRTESLGNQTLTRVCWLNQSLRSLADPLVMAEVAADNKIKLIDLPRQLSAEINETGSKVFAPMYQKKFNLTGKGVIVAVIDSEVALNHPAIKNRVVHRRNYTQESWGNPDSHDTAVAGIIASDDKKFKGMAPQSTIYNYKVLASSPFLNGDDFDGALAIQHALEDGVHIANCSWGAGPAGDGNGREARACNAAWELGMAIVKSAGNKGPNPGTLTAPADAEGVIVVGATDKKGFGIEEYSSRGPTPFGLKRPHLVAPGGSPSSGIMSCLTTGGFGPCGYGTSFAAPHVTGLLALILDGDPDLTPDEQRNMLLKICTKLENFDNDSQGEGLISMLTLIEATE